MMYWASRSMSSRSRESTRRPRWTLKPEVNPASQYPGPLGRQQPLVDQKCDHPCPEEFLQGLETGLGHDVEDPQNSLCHLRAQPRRKFEKNEGRLPPQY